MLEERKNAFDVLAKGDFCKQVAHNLNVFIIVEASGLPRPESTCLQSREGVAGSREKYYEGTDHKHLKHRGFNRKETAHLVTTYPPSGKERPDRERVHVFVKGTINPNSSGCLVSLSTPGLPAVHKALGRERGRALVAPLPWRCVSPRD